MPPPNNTLPMPPSSVRLRLDIDAELLPGLRAKSLELGLSTASVCRAVVEMFAAGKLPIKAIQAEVKRRCAAKPSNKSTHHYMP